MDRDRDARHFGDFERLVAMFEMYVAAELNALKGPDTRQRYAADP